MSSPPKRKRLSQEARDARRPPPPDVLANSINEVVHEPPRRVRPARTVKVKRLKIAPGVPAMTAAQDLDANRRARRAWERQRWPQWAYYVRESARRRQQRRDRRAASVDTARALGLW